MKIIFHRKFKNDVSKLQINQKKRVNDAVKTFSRNPSDPSLNNHALKGKEQGNRSISAGGDLRIIFRETGGYTEVLFLRVGTHSKLY